MTPLIEIHLSLKSTEQITSVLLTLENAVIKYWLNLQ